MRSDFFSIKKMIFCPKKHNQTPLSFVIWGLETRVEQNTHTTITKTITDRVRIHIHLYIRHKKELNKHSFKMLNS